MPTQFMRLRRLRRSLVAGRGALLLTHLPNLLYLVGFRGTSGVLVVTRRAVVLFVPGLYRDQARGEVTGARVRVAPDPLRAAADWLRRSNLRRVACENHHLSVAQFEQLRQWLGREIELADAESLAERLRAIKSSAEIRQIRAALALTARAFEEVLPLVRPGVRELELAAEIEFRLKRYGARGAAFETIVASGPRSALPHGRATAKRLKKNELVIFDLGAILDDYHSDMTRTVYLGRPPARVKRIYGAVKEALEHAHAAVRA
ncbi:MAG: M24 family metallopeptidase, partial [Candidatus Acidiferrales bacterium]